MKLRAPAVPLITVDPFFSVWSPENNLNFAKTMHWTGKSNHMLGSVTVDGKEYGTYALSTDLKLEITGNTEGRVNILVIKNGEAYVDYADCPDLICARHRPKKNVGDSIVCLPNKVVVTVIGNGGKVDTVS